MEIQVQEILKTKARLIQIYVQHNTARKSYNDFYGDMERDNFMNPDESLKYGLIDKIIDKRSRITITQAMREGSHRCLS